MVLILLTPGVTSVSKYLLLRLNKLALSHIGKPAKKFEL